MPDNSLEDFDHSDHPVVNERGRNCGKSSDTTSDIYDHIGKEWVVKATSVKPIYSSASYNPESLTHCEEAEQHRLEDQLE
jgi:hypothetical protein